MVGVGLEVTSMSNIKLICIAVESGLRCADLQIILAFWHPEPMAYNLQYKNVNNWPKNAKKDQNQSIISASSEHFWQLECQDSALFACLVL